MVERLPTLYPMPRDREQYWVCVRAAADGPEREAFRSRLSLGLLKLGGSEAYGKAMIDRIESNLTGNGFIDATDNGERVGVPLHAREWDGSDDGFAKYIGETIKRWGSPAVGFHSGLVLAIDLLSLLTEKPKTAAQLLSLLTNRTESKAKYDGNDKSGDRTIREFLKLLQFAMWTRREGSGYVITREGRKTRPALAKLDLLHRAELLIQQFGSDTQVFDPDDKIAIAKYYMYRQCGGKGKDQYFLQRVARAIYSRTSSLRPRVSSKIRRERERIKQEKVALLEEIRKWDEEIGRQASNIRNLERLYLLREAAKSRDVSAAWGILGQAGGRFSWQTVRRLHHGGSDYTIRPGLTPYKWQREALESWNDKGKRGVLEVVTGAGKTVFALLALADLYQANPDVRVTVLVPTKVLMYQWAVELVRLLGVPADDVGLRGDGYKDSFVGGKKVMVVIVNSAILEGYLREDVGSLPLTVPHFLVADECHRYRGEEFRRAFECRTDWSLGLSATPRDQPESERSVVAETDVIIEKIGPIIYNYNYKQALRDQIIQSFTVTYLGVDLTVVERKAYGGLTKRLAKALERIRQRYGPRLEAMSAKSFDQRLQVILKTDDEPDPAIQDYFRLVRERKSLVFRALNRKRCYLDLISRHKDDKVIVFHERIEDLEEIVAPFDRRQQSEDDGGVIPSDGLLESDRALEDEVDKLLENLFKKPSFRAVMYHSGHARQFWNAIAMDWFRTGVSNVMLSVKALVEGVDVPKARVGIIRTSSSSVRQRIQTTGRILRRASGKDLPAGLFVIYVRDTTDERIFRGMKWSEQIGSSSIVSVHWHPPEDVSKTEGHWEDLQGALPSPPSMEEEAPLEVDVTGLAIGATYPGRYAGVELHVDARGCPFRRTRDGRRFIKNREIRVAAMQVRSLKGGGKLVLTPQGHLVTKVRGEGLVFLGESDDLEYEDRKHRVVVKLEGRPPTFAELFPGSK